STPFSFALGATPNERGEFSILNLLEGNYRLKVRLPAEWWYTRSLSLPGTQQPQPGGAPQKPGAAASALTLKMGQTLAGVAVQIAQDGGSIRGRVRPAAEGLALPTNLKVHLVPTERERAEDLLRYSEVVPGDDGAFSLTNLAPGRYKLLVRAITEEELTSTRPLAWDASARAGLRREADAATPLELKPCGRVADYELRYAPVK
ncbi:MAG TPA: carboxypeptidase-like regulatory domain-containing protein, partial [Pyrinomonadaceae bacterium]|nr:carboxypeptidase-like regulatory domain-containing protein [Pyrinomonadaceae bacterium]